MPKEHTVEINGSFYRYAYDPSSQRTVYLGPVGSAPDLGEEQFFMAMASQKEYSFSNIKNDPNSFYNKPKMRGHYWAIEKLDMMEQVANKYGKTDLQRWLLDYVWRFDIDDRDDNAWHYFENRITKKHISLMRQTLRAVDKSKEDGTMDDLRIKIMDKQGMLKDRLTWSMELLAWEHDRDDYIRSYQRDMAYLGMKPAESRERLGRYIDSLRIR